MKKTKKRTLTASTLLRQRLKHRKNAVLLSSPERELKLTDLKRKMSSTFETVWGLLKSGHKVVLTMKNKNFKQIINQDIRKKEFLQVEFVKSERYIKYIDWSGETWDLDNEPFKIKNVLDSLSQRGPVTCIEYENK